jgi:LmbE family N-acetylglucosaminyl deacetylase
MTAPPPLIHGRSTSEAQWRPWLHQHLSRPEPFTHWLPDTARLVVLAPHPDDEVLACGALLALHSARGGNSLIVAVTDGEASHREANVSVHTERTLTLTRSDEHELALTRRDEQELALTRSAERLQGLHQLDVSAQQLTSLHLPDGDVARHESELTRRITSLLQPSDVIVSPWRRDGHPDHDACGRAAARASAATGRPLWEAPVWMWHWARPNDARVPWLRMQALAVSDAARASKQAALAAHVSQLTPRSPTHGAVLNDEIVERAQRRAEYFFV